MAPDSNPYASPSADSSQGQSRFRWRVIPAGLVFGMGLLCTLFGIFAVGVMVYVLLMKQFWAGLPDMIAGCLIYLSAGLLWVFAGWKIGHGAFWSGSLLFIAGILVPLGIIVLVASSLAL